MCLHPFHALNSAYVHRRVLCDDHDGDGDVVVVVHRGDLFYLADCDYRYYVKDSYAIVELPLSCHP